MADESSGKEVLQGKAAISLRYLSDIGGRCQGDIGDIYIDPAKHTGEGREVYSCRRQLCI